MPAKRQKKYCLPKLKITVMTNDTIDTFAYSIRTLPNTRVVMGLILGAGCNSAVPMKLTDLQNAKIQHIREKDPDAEETIVSTEWTLRGASEPLEELKIMNKWDAELEAHSNRPGFQPLEYMVGGRTKALPRSSLPTKLVEEYTLTTDFLSLVVAPTYSDEALAKELSHKLPAPESSDWAWTSEYAGHLRSIAAAVQDRSAALIAAATVGLLACTREIQLQDTESPDSPAADTSDKVQQTANQENQPPEFGSSTSGWQNGPEELVVPVSGGVTQHYPLYKQTIQRYIDRLTISAGPQGEGKSIFLREASDGGIIGVGVLAGTIAGEIKGIIGSTMEEQHRFEENLRESCKDITNVC
ncbi:actin-like ATPase domain-containing protein [Penicillium verhagenii]|nr:actin-like ATPase domain-containing protein [Penicillium verhagenii]